MFEFLFKYPAELYGRGDIVLSGPPWLYPAAIVAAAVLAGLFYTRARGRVGTGHRVILAALRLAVLAIVIALLLDPVLVVSTVEPRGRIVSVLLDDSLSMRIADQEGGPRGRFVDEAFHPSLGRVSASLEKRFTSRFFRFAEGTEPLAADDAMTYAGERTRLAQALDSVRESVGGASAAVVLVSDGAVEDAGALEEALAELRAAGIPVSTVGVGRTSYTRDIEVSRVGMPRRVPRGSSVAADVVIRQRGFGNERVQLRVEDEGRLVAMEEMVLHPDEPVSSRRVYLSTDDPGPRRLSFHIRASDDETVRENNRRELLLGVDESPREILYFEGEPRFELKFIRRAVAEDRNIRLHCLIRTAEAKYYRVGIDDPEELADGFPADRDALFKYQAVILGSVEASYFSAEQLDLLEEFVGVRGGGLLILGGRRAFAEGGYAATPVAELLPVVLGDRKRHRFEVEALIRPTRAGRSHPITRLDGADADPWETLPPLTVLHPLYAVKPGASTLLEGLAAGDPRPLAILAEQRYGRGRVLVLNAQNTWLWQMHHDIPLDDQRHETLWRQLLRWLVRSVPDRVSIDTGGAHFTANQTVQVDSEVLDDGYRPRNDAAVELVVIDPLGEESRLPMAWQPTREGTYRTRFAPRHQGLYELRVEVDSEPAGYLAGTQVQVGAQSSEYFGAEMREGLLRHIAAQTGGIYYPAGEAQRLADELPIAAGGITVVKRLTLRDMPAAFLLILLLLTVEWTYRRFRGLA